MEKTRRAHDRFDDDDVFVFSFLPPPSPRSAHTRRTCTRSPARRRRYHELEKTRNLEVSSVVSLLYLVLRLGFYSRPLNWIGPNISGQYACRPSALFVVLQTALTIDKIAVKSHAPIPGAKIMERARAIE